MDGLIPTTSVNFYENRFKYEYYLHKTAADDKLLDGTTKIPILTSTRGH